MITIMLKKHAVKHSDNSLFVCGWEVRGLREEQRDPPSLKICVFCTGMASVKNFAVRIMLQKLCYEFWVLEDNVLPVG